MEYSSYPYAQATAPGYPYYHPQSSYSPYMTASSAASPSSNGSGSTSGGGLLGASNGSSSSGGSYHLASLTAQPPISGIFNHLRAKIKIILQKIKPLKINY